MIGYCENGHPNKEGVRFCGKCGKPIDPDIGLLVEELRGKYEITRQLGLGGMGAVYEATYEAAGEPFKLGSTKQIQELLFDKHKLPVLAKTPKGQPSDS